MTKNKTAALLAAILMSTSLLLTACAGEAPNAAEAIPPVAEQEEETAAEEEAADQAAAEEAARLAEEEAAKAQEELNQRIAAWEEEKSVFIASEGASVYATPTRSGELVASLDRVSRAYRVGEVTDQATGEIFYGLKESYEAPLLGYIGADDVVSQKEELIYKRYDDVDYGPFEKMGDRENNPPVKVRGIFMTAHSAATSNFDRLLEIVDTTDINTLVIDVKDDNDNILFYSETAEKYNPGGNKVFIKDMEAFMKELDDRGIYTIARVVVFKSPKYAKLHPDRAIVHRATGQPFSNKDGAYWASPFDRDLWDYNVGVSKEAVAHGFDEVQFDYVRFPASAENRMDATLDYRNTELESKTAAIQGFLKYAYGELAPMGAYVSADVFGWAATAVTDVGIGQHWEAITSVVDYICPMIYPSHYGPGIFGFAVPDAHPYGTVYAATIDAMERNANTYTPATIRPWIQDFTARWIKGHISYGHQEILDQVRALEEAGVDEYMFWNAGNSYTTSAFDELVED